MKYRVNAVCTISLSTVVEASSPEEAIRIAEGRSIETITTKGDDAEEWVTSSEIDGVPTDLSVGPESDDDEAEDEE